jgi:hypothetical protein
MFFGKGKSKGREGKEKGRELVNGADVSQCIFIVLYVAYVVFNFFL